MGYFGLKKLIRLFLAINLLSFSFAISIDAATIYGKVKRQPAQTKPEKAISRYRGAESLISQDAGEDCVCNPGLFSVVYLTGGNLPPIVPPDSIPKMAQKDKMFVPSVLAVAVGTSVDFPNLDPFFHNVFSYSKPKQFDLGRYPKGESQQVTFDKPGIVKVFCEIHYSMRSYVHVLETPYFATSDEKGSFVIKNVPVGEYQLNVWQENLSNLSQTININGDSVFLEIGQ
ncbi:MAG TPA: plastocyanin/azurin family copper-binding protein [candidate division Zixibacteria bacterium]|nr:plastocyanin/azurin family copper-binding protein [candidate division Zixibacteria bacterium]